MPTRNVNLTEKLDRFVLEKVDTGCCENASEVVRAALRTLEREEREYGLRSAIDAGDASGIAEGNVFDRVRKTLNFRTALRSPVPAFRYSRRVEADRAGIAQYTLRT